eukprot:8206447-Pyramimonas_sp.AAC.1
MGRSLLSAVIAPHRACVEGRRRAARRRAAAGIPALLAPIGGGRGPWRAASTKALHVFDFDGTLVLTPAPAAGDRLYREATGRRCGLELYTHVKHVKRITPGRRSDCEACAP